MTISRCARFFGVLAIVLPLAACGGGGSSSSGTSSPTGNNGSSSSGPNVVPVVSNLGVSNNNANGLFTSVTVCMPGTTNCTTVNNVLVDTGSFGLRLLSTALSSLPLTTSSAPDGNPLGECTDYASSYIWGPVATADVSLGGEKAANVPIQVIGQSGFPDAPSSCTSGGLTENNSQSTLQANGILGVGVFRYDCGPACTPPNTTVPPVYFSCPSSGCSAVLVPEADEVQNPVAFFATDNNGELLQLPSVPDAGAASVNGYMIFGIGTENNNALSTQTVLQADDYGDFTTTFDSNTYSGSLLDSGSNGIFFLDAQTLNITDCASPDTGFYCPASQLAPYQATNVSADGSTTAPASWNVANADTLFQSGNAAFNNLAGDDPNTFDFGLSFFFGRTIGVGLNGASASAQGKSYAGPFYAY